MFLLHSKTRLKAAPELLNSYESNTKALDWRAGVLSPRYYTEFIKPYFVKHVFSIQEKRVFKAVIPKEIFSVESILYFCTDTNTVNTANRAIFCSELVTSSSRNLFLMLGQHQRLIIKSLEHLANNRHFSIDFLQKLLEYNEISVMLLTDLAQTLAGRGMFMTFLPKAISKGYSVYFGFSDYSPPCVIKVTKSEDVQQYYPKYISNYGSGYINRCAFVLNKKINIDNALLPNVKVIHNCQLAESLGLFKAPKSLTLQQLNEIYKDM